MKLFKDKELKEEIQDLDLGIVQAGDEKSFTFYVLNDSKARLINLKFSVSHKEVEIIDSPVELKSEESHKLIVKWKPSITLKEGLKTPITITGKELWG